MITLIIALICQLPPNSKVVTPYHFSVTAVGPGQVSPPSIDLITNAGHTFGWNPSVGATGYLFNVSVITGKTNHFPTGNTNFYYPPPGQSITQAFVITAIFTNDFATSRFFTLCAATNLTDSNWQPVSSQVTINTTNL